MDDLDLLEECVACASTSGDAQSERNVPRRSAPSCGAGCGAGASSVSCGWGNEPAPGVSPQRTPRPPIWSSVSPP